MNLERFPPPWVTKIMLCIWCGAYETKHIALGVCADLLFVAWVFAVGSYIADAVGTYPLFFSDIFSAQKLLLVGRVAREDGVVTGMQAGSSQQGVNKV